MSIVDGLVAPEQPNLFDVAEARRDLGIERVGNRADRVEPAWRERAAGLIRQFSNERACGQPFLIEDVVPFARSAGLPDPPDGRAWGSAVQSAKRRGYIVSCGFRRARTSNLSPKVLWRAKSCTN